MDFRRFFIKIKCARFFYSLIAECFGLNSFPSTFDDNFLIFLTEIELNPFFF